MIYLLKAILVLFLFIFLSFWLTIIISIGINTAWKIREKGKKNGLNKSKRESL